MVITEKDISNAGEEKSAGKKAFDIWKKLWILGAIISVPLLILIIVLMIVTENTDDDSEYTAPQTDSVSILMFSDFYYGCQKDELTKMLQGKGWMLTNSYKATNEFNSYCLEFNTDNAAVFQRQIVNLILAEFDENDALQELSIFFDVSPEALRANNFTSIERKLEAVAEQCLLYQGYTEYKNSNPDVRSFADADRNIALYHFEDDNIKAGHVHITYISAELFEKTVSKNK